MLSKICTLLAFPFLSFVFFPDTKIFPSETRSVQKKVATTVRFTNCRIPSSLINNPRLRYRKLQFVPLVQVTGDNELTIKLLGYIVGDRGERYASEPVELEREERTVVMDGGFYAGVFEVTQAEKVRLFNNGTSRLLRPDYIILEPVYDTATMMLHFNLRSFYLDRTDQSRVPAPGRVTDVYADPSPPAPPSLTNYFKK